MKNSSISPTKKKLNFSKLHKTISENLIANVLQ